MTTNIIARTPRAVLPLGSVSGSQDCPERKKVAIEAVEQAPSTISSPWKVLIVDDEPDVHAITRLVLRDTAFEGRKVEFLNAYSAEEAEEILQRERDVAAAIVDVVMETDDAGLRLAKWIREELRNRLVRIILRTGRPGEAPERSVIVDYDINDYREKSELTDVRLLTMLVSALRGYRDLHMLEISRKGFARIAEASGELFRKRTIPEFIGDVLVQLSSLIAGSEDSLLVDSAGLGVEAVGESRVIAGTGAFTDWIGTPIQTNADSEGVTRVLEEVRTTKRSLFRSDLFAGYYRSADDRDIVLIVQPDKPIGEAEQSVLEAFNANVALAFENLTLTRHVEEAQLEMIYMLSEAVEKRSHETGNHVRRVALVARAIARGVGLTPEEVRAIHLAAPLHDVGKLSIQDSILLKPDKLTQNEMETMKLHTIWGYEILKPYNRGLLPKGAEMARSHHERWKGQGYPDGLAGEDIPLAGRILAVADVMDALSHDRVYKKAWPIEDVFEYIQKESGNQFDPAITAVVEQMREELTDILLERKDLTE